MSIVRKYSKPSSFYLNIKAAFFKNNDALLEESKKKNSFYASQPNRLACKLCGSTLSANDDFVSHSVSYVFCDECGHLNGRHDDTEDFVERLYISDAGSDYAKNYLDSEYQQRTVAIYVPKIDWLVSSLPAKPFSILDVGCGAGYLVAASMLRNITAKGLDVSESMIEFGNHQIAHLMRRNVSPLKSSREAQFFDEIVETDCEVISAIGVIEHLRNPHMLFEAFKKSDAKYLFYSVPMFSVSVILENIFTKVFPRQLSGAHTHLFTESSIQKMNEMLGANVVSEWRFGTDMMDFYRSAVTMLEKNGTSDKLLKIFSDSFASSIDDLQSVLDEKHFCSEIHCVVAK